MLFVSGLPPGEMCIRDRVYNYVVQNITYDKQLAASVKSGYLPVLDTVLAKKTGICFDYAALMTGKMCIRDRYDRCHDIRRVGAASVDLCYVAAGRLDAYMEIGLKPWDYAAGLLIVQEAGGAVVTVDGGAPSLKTGSGILGTNGAVTQELLTVLCQTANG